MIRDFWDQNVIVPKQVKASRNVAVNTVRPIPFIIFITAIGPLTKQVVGTTIGTDAVIFPMAIMGSFAFSRIVEQNLVALDPGVIEAARAMGGIEIQGGLVSSHPGGFGAVNSWVHILVRRHHRHVCNGWNDWRWRAGRLRD